MNMMVSHVVNNICKIAIHVTFKLLRRDLFMILPNYMYISHARRLSPNNDLVNPPIILIELEMLL